LRTLVYATIPNEEEKVKYIKANCFNELDLDSPIYRFLKYEDFITYNLSKSKLSMANPKIWPDPYDALLFSSTVKVDNKSYADMKILMDQVYVLCWTDKAESELWWSHSSRCDNRSVRLKSTPRKILKYLFDFEDAGFYNKYFAGKIVYINREDYITATKNLKLKNFFGTELHMFLIKSLFIKTEEHSDESEVRFVFYDLEMGEANSNKLRHHFEININHVIDEITLHPNLAKGKIECMTNEIVSMGYKNCINQSELNLYPNGFFLDLSKS